nr:hypothetical protein [Sphingomonas sp.]
MKYHLPAEKHAIRQKIVRMLLDRRIGLTDGLLIGTSLVANWHYRKGEMPGKGKSR